VFIKLKSEQKMNKFNNYYDYYSSLLHNSLRAGKLQDDNDTGIYLVIFRVIGQQDKRQIVYNYIYFPKIFINSLLCYFITKENFNRSIIYREWGDFFTIIDEGLFIDENICELKETMLYNEYFMEWENKDIFPEQDNIYIRAFDGIKKTSVVEPIDSLVNLIHLFISKQYLEFLSQVNPEIKSDDRFKDESIAKDIYLMRDCLFVVKDLQFLLLYLEKLNYKTSKGNRSLGNILLFFVRWFILRKI